MSWHNKEKEELWNTKPNIDKGDLISSEDITGQGIYGKAFSFTIEQWLNAVKTRADQIYRGYCHAKNCAVCMSYNASDNTSDRGVWTSNYTVKGK